MRRPWLQPLGRWKSDSSPAPCNVCTTFWLLPSHSAQVVKLGRKIAQGKTRIWLWNTEKFPSDFYFQLPRSHPFFRTSQSQTLCPLQPDLMDAFHPAKPVPLHPNGPTPLWQQIPRNWSSNEASHPIGCFMCINLSRLLNAIIDRCLSPLLDPTFLYYIMLFLPLLSHSNLQKLGFLLLIWALIILRTLKTRIKPKKRKRENAHSYY